MLAIGDKAEAILIRMLNMCPSLDTGCPKARETVHLLQLPTVHDNIGSDVVRTDLVIILLFDTLTSILHAFALSIRVLKVTILPPIRPVSSANRTCGGHGVFSVCTLGTS